MKNSLLLIFLSMCLWSEAQVTMERNIIASCGNHFTNGNLSLSWTMGEPVTQTYTNGNIIMCQGFQVGNHLYTNSKERPLPYPLEIYPNPTSNWIYITSDAIEALDLEIFDLSGKLFSRQHLDFPLKNSPISLEQLPAATYLMRISNTDGNFETFKIQKLN